MTATTPQTYETALHQLLDTALHGSLADPVGEAARLKCRTDPYYAALPGMKLFNRLLAQWEESGESTSRSRPWQAAADLATDIVAGMAIIEEGEADALRTLTRVHRCAGTFRGQPCPHRVEQRGQICFACAAGR